MSIYLERDFQIQREHDFYEASKVRVPFWALWFDYINQTYCHVHFHRLSEKREKNKQFSMWIIDGTKLSAKQGLLFESDDANGSYNKVLILHAIYFPDIFIWKVMLFLHLKIDRTGTLFYEKNIVFLWSSDFLSQLLEVVTVNVKNKNFQRYSWLRWIC